MNLLENVKLPASLPRVTQWLVCLGLLAAGVAGLLFYFVYPALREVDQRPELGPGEGTPTAAVVGPGPSTSPAGPEQEDAPRPDAAASGPLKLRDVTAETGITFQHTDGSSGRRYVIESMTGGVAVFDFNLDGKNDIYFLNGAPLKGTEVDTAPANAFYRNLGDWRFVDVTEQTGLGDLGFGLGVAVADYTNDGFPDVYVNNFGPNVLYRNNGDGTFTVVTELAAVGNGDRMGAGAAFLDIDGDGNLDLYVANYIEFSYDQHRPHTMAGRAAYPSPLNYAADSDTLYRNNNDGTFTDVSQESGVAAHAGRGMGIVCGDFDNDGDLDIFVANDLGANFLFQNDGTGRFTDVGLESGIAFDIIGTPQASMGVDAADFDNNGLFDFHVTAFSREFEPLYRNLGSGLFEDASRVTGAGAPTFAHVTWGNGFADFDNDGNRDLFVACGHLDDTLESRTGAEATAFEVPNVLLRNTGGGRFVDVSKESGDGMQVALSSRGMALGDLDNDGKMDVVVLNSRSKPTVLRNESPSDHHWVQIRLRGVESNRDGIGARVTVVAGDLVQIDEVRNGRGYQSHFCTRLHFGLGQRDHIDRIEIQWLGGGTDVVKNVPADRILTIVEGTSDYHVRTGFQPDLR